MTTKVFYGLIILTSALLTVVNINLQEYVIAGLTLAAGVVWLFLQIRKKETPHSAFFVFFLGLTVLGSLRNMPIPLMLIALSSDLAAWDLARFQTRIMNEDESPSKRLLELKHLQKIALTLAIGFFIALLPSFIHISLNFVVFLFIVLAAMLVLRQSIINLRKESKTSD